MNIKTPQNWRKGQTLFNFLEWLRTDHDYAPHPDNNVCADPFHIDDALLDKLYEEYLSTLEVTYETDEL